MLFFAAWLLARRMQGQRVMPTRKSLVRRLTLVIATTFMMFAPSWAQIRTPDANSEASLARWHEYVNKEYGFSFLYPDAYKPIVANNSCQDNYYRRYLLCLSLTGGGEPVISVTVVVAAPFHVSPGSGDVMPTRQKIGRHVFYCGGRRQYRCGL